MRKFKFFAVIFTLMMFLSSFAACDFLMSSQQPASSSTHTCESVCEECGKCTDAECADDVCAEKCECEAVEPEPEHECESVCPTCEKCLDADCTEEACAEKCQGHSATPDPEPEHECESVCPTCNKCLDADCTEEACAEKCQGHSATPDPEPEHECESVCPTCNKCLDADCTEEACAEKCEGHSATPDPEPEHECESVCPTCNKCLDADCTEEACAEKCQGHSATPDPEPEHECESVCPTCNKCLDADCTEEACAEKCQGHHVCESVCPTCNKCLDADCTEEACVEKCQGHHVCESVCPTCNKCLDADCTEEACAEKCQGHHVCESICETCGACTDVECTEEACENKCPGHVVIPEHECESVCAKCGMCQDATCTETACKYKCPGHVVGAEWDMYDLKVVSFNVKIPGTAPDGCSWTQRSPNILKYLNNSGAHIIGLQEVSETPRKDITAGIDATKYTFVYFGDDSSNLAMIYDHTVFNLIRTEKYWMSDTPDKKSNGWDAGNYRAACLLYLEHKVTGEMVKAINTHGPLSDEGNVKGFNLIAERSLSDDTPMFTVLTGDFNARPIPPADRPNELGYKIIAEKLQDTRVVAAESPCRWHSTWSGFEESTKTAHESTAQLDHIFVTRSEDVEVLTYKVNLESGSAPFLSDHYPIESTVRVFNPNNSWTGYY